MELHQLRYFCAVVETGSFSRAAEQSHVSQPSLSQQILKLEDELGARLFDRLGRSVRLTELGKTFLPRARAVLRELEAAKGDVVEGKEFIGGPITVGVIPTVSPYFLPPRLTTFTRKFSQVRLTVVEEITPVLLDRLRSGTIDVALLALPIRGREFDAFPLLTERLFAALPKKHKLNSRRSLALKNFPPNLSLPFPAALVFGIPPFPPSAPRLPPRQSVFKAARSASFPALSARAW